MPGGAGPGAGKREREWPLQKNCSGQKKKGWVLEASVQTGHGHSGGHIGDKHVVVWANKASGLAGGSGHAPLSGSPSSSSWGVPHFRPSFRSTVLQSTSMAITLRNSVLLLFLPTLRLSSAHHLSGSCPSMSTAHREDRGQRGVQPREPSSPAQKPGCDSPTRVT